MGAALRGRHPQKGIEMNFMGWLLVAWIAVWALIPVFDKEWWDDERF